MQYIVIFLLLIVINLITLIYLLNEKNKKSQKKIEEFSAVLTKLSTHPIANYENDIKFLLSTITHNLQSFAVFTLKPRQTAGFTIINDELFEEWRLQLVTNIYSTLSENYKKNLHAYFTEESLREFIIEKVNMELLELSLSMKFKLSKEDK